MSVGSVKEPVKKKKEANASDKMLNRQSSGAYSEPRPTSKTMPFAEDFFACLEVVFDKFIWFCSLTLDFQRYH